MTVVITTACSGIYSFGIFASAFVAFVLTEFQRLGRRVWILLGLGLATAYVANVLRMVIIVLVGYYTDSTETDLQNMLVAHSYAGWLIFLGWITLFWSVLLKIMPREQPLNPPRRVSEPDRRYKTRCSVCAGALTPAIPSVRCTCGSFLHKTCSIRSSRCPSCARLLMATTGNP